MKLWPFPLAEALCLPSHGLTGTAKLTGSSGQRSQTGHSRPLIDASFENLDPASTSVTPEAAREVTSGEFGCL